MYVSDIRKKKYAGQHYRCLILENGLSLYHHSKLALTNQLLHLGKPVVEVQATRVQQRSRGLDPLAGHNLLDWELHFLEVDRRLVKQFFVSSLLFDWEESRSLGKQGVVHLPGFPESQR